MNWNIHSFSRIKNPFANYHRLPMIHFPLLILSDLSHYQPIRSKRSSTVQLVHLYPVFWALPTIHQGRSAWFATKFLTTLTLFYGRDSNRRRRNCCLYFCCCCGGNIDRWCDGIQWCSSIVLESSSTIYFALSICRSYFTVVLYRSAGLAE